MKFIGISEIYINKKQVVLYFNNVIPHLIKGKISIKMADKKLSNNLIEILRKTVEDRYTFENLDRSVTKDKSITKERLDELRDFFLNYIYPDAKSRLILNNAFENLEKHFKNPRHLMDLLGSGISIAFKLGFHFPKALKAAIHTLESFRQAIKFENLLVSEAISKKIKTPISTDDFDKLISRLPRNLVQEFIKSSDELFHMLTDIPLLERSLKIIEELVEKMKSKPDIYDQSDIEGITTGYDILKGGYHLFCDMNSDEKLEIIEFVKEVENRNLERIYSIYPNN